MKTSGIIVCFALVILAGLGCNAVVVEEDGVPVGNREGLIAINPAGNAFNDLDALVELAYEKVVDDRDSSLLILGYGRDTRDDHDSTALYLLAGGRYYPTGKAPEGFFIHGDIGFGHYTYHEEDEADVSFMYGLGAGYKMVFGAFLLDLGGGWLRAEFAPNDHEYLPVMRIMGGMKF